MIARCPDGQELAYRVEGGGTHPPIVTVHGLVSSVHHWKFFTPHFAATRRVISWDYRGHAGQPLRDPDVGVEQFADDARVVIDTATPDERVVVVGLSFGVQVALEIWRRHRERVRALVLICGTPGHPLDRVSTSPALRHVAAAALRRLGRQHRIGAAVLALLRSPAGTRIARELAFASGGAHRDACPIDVLDDLFAHVGGLAPELIGNVTAAYLEHSAWDVLSTIDVPTLVIAGDRDQLTPVTTAERMHRAISASQLVVFPGHTHLVQVEKPREVHAAIEHLLAGL